MRILKREIVYNGQFIRINKKTFLAKNGKKGIWEVVERQNLYKRIVIIFALTKNKEVILEKIYRIPLEAYTIELPAGLTDKAGETEEEAAKRELLEETGYRAEKMIEVFSSVGSPGLTNGEYVYFFAPDVEQAGEIKRDDAEEMEVFTVPLHKLVAFLLKPQKGIKIDDKILNVLPILEYKGLI